MAAEKTIPRTYASFGFATNLSTTKTIDVGTTLGGDDIFSGLVLPAGEHPTLFPTVRCPLAADETIYFTEIDEVGDGDTLILILTNNQS